MNTDDTDSQFAVNLLSTTKTGIYLRIKRALTRLEHMVFCGADSIEARGHTVEAFCQKKCTAFGAGNVGCRLREDLRRHCGKHRNAR